MRRRILSWLAYILVGGICISSLPKALFHEAKREWAAVERAPHCANWKTVMVKEETTFGVSPRRLAKLLALGVQRGKDNPGGGGTPAEVLREILDTQLPLDPTLPNSLPTVLSWTSDEVLSAAGRTLRDLLLDPETHLVVIRTLKDYGKGLVRRPGPGAKQAAATVIYYGAIANGLVFHGRKITQHSYRTLHKAYTELRRKSWIPSELKDLFRRALAVCRQQKRKPA